jgi:glycosyltransferase involved in cell wall biosynthesis
MSQISVIIPVKNRAALLRKTLDNLLSQSMKPDEIIVVDDHSTDEIQLVIFDYITDCIFLNNKGTGPGAARNLGLSVATGKYIQFFDSDDLMTPRKLEKQFLALESSGLDMAYGPYVQAQETETGWIQKDVIMQSAGFDSSLDLCDWILRGWNSITQACLFRKEFVNRLKPWNEKLITHEDYLYLFHASLLNPGTIHVPDEAVIYRQHGKQSTDMATLSAGRAIDKMEVLTEIRSQLPSVSTDFLTKGLFKGRLAQNYSFLKNNGIDPRRYSGFMETGDFLWEFIYRIYNKQMRNKTGTSWEPMHGVSTSASEFQKIIECLK